MLADVLRRSPLFPSPRALATVAATLLALMAHDAHANGRFPAAGQIALSPTDATTVVVRTTFGLLVSRDRASSFDWVCEPAIGLTDDQDPQVALFGDGTLSLSPYEGLAQSFDGACSFSFAKAQTSGESMIDLSVCRSAPDHAVAISWSPVTRASTLYATSDAGKAWAAHGALPDTDVVPQTLDVAPSSTSRVLVSGTFSAGGKLKGAVFRSNDGGQTFARADIALEGEAGLYLAAIDPTTPDRVYVRTAGNPGNPGSRLLVSNNGGASFEAVTSTAKPMLGFALSPDGKRVALGSEDGVSIASSSDLAFTKVWSQPVSCLAWGDDGLYACGPAGGPFAVGLSTDEGKTFAAKLPALADIRGVLACPDASPTTQLCGPAWEAQKALLPGGGDAGTGGAGGEGGTASGASGSGGLGGTHSDAGESAAGTSDGQASEPDDGCSIVGTGAGRLSIAALLMATASALLLGRRRR